MKVAYEVVEVSFLSVRALDNADGGSLECARCVEGLVGVWVRGEG